MRESNRIADRAVAAVGRGSRPRDRQGIAGRGVAEIRGPEGLRRVAFCNLITQVGDQFYGERAAGIASPPGQVTGMQLGTGVTAPSKTGAGAAVVTYITGSDQPIEGGFPTSGLEEVDGDDVRRITWRAFWDEGDATEDGITEVVLVNRALDDSAATAAQTIARALFDTPIDKAANETLRVTWEHDLFAAPPA